MHLCKRWVCENAYRSLKSWKDLSTFDNHSPFQKSVFGHSKYILGDVLDKYVYRQKWHRDSLRAKSDTVTKTLLKTETTTNRISPTIVFKNRSVLKNLKILQPTHCGQ